MTSSAGAGRPIATKTWLAAAVAKELILRGYTTAVGEACIAAAESLHYMDGDDPSTYSRADNVGDSAIRRAYQKINKTADGYQFKSDGSKYRVCLIPEEFIEDAKNRLRAHMPKGYTGGTRAVLDGKTFLGVTVLLTGGRS